MSYMSGKKTQPRTPSAKRLEEIQREQNFDNRRAFAEAVGVSEDALRKWGERDSIEKNGALDIATKFGYSPSWIMWGIGPRRSEAGEERPHIIALEEIFSRIPISKREDAISAVRAMASLIGGEDEK